jgi:SAM-dependent methyltransferase
MVESSEEKIAFIIRHILPSSVLLRFRNAYHSLFPEQWCRVVMNRETDKYVKSLEYKAFKVLEISGSKWEKFGFASYRSIEYPSYDLCEGTLNNETFDIIIAEQVLEHVLYPYRAVKNLYRMLNPGGLAVITIPFLLKIHGAPIDCSRWTELGLKHLLAEGGFDPEKIITGSWGNRDCVIANFQRWMKWMPWIHSLKNEPDFPVAVWAFAHK